VSTQRLTTNSSETDIASFLSSDAIFSIPYFQRPYKWEKVRLDQLCKDLLKVVDENSSHFLGAIIIHGRPSDPSDPKVYEVIDGQQRITTIFIILLALVRVFCKAGEYSEAVGLFQRYLVIGREISYHSNSKLHSSRDDRAQLNFVINEILADQEFAARLPHFTYRQLNTTADDNGRLRKNFRAAVRFFDQEFEAEGIQRVKELYFALVRSMTFVQIDVTDPTNGPKIFDSLNSRQEPMTIGDLVRNEIFSKISDASPAILEETDISCWRPFYEKFIVQGANYFDEYFFPYGLVLDPNIKKSEVYARLREKWGGIGDPKTIISELTRYQDAFLDLVLGTNKQGHVSAVSSAFRRLHTAKAPSSTFPFLMQLSDGAKRGIVSVADCVEILETVESFLVRRAICGHEPTGLHSVFKRLWADCKDEITAKRVESEIRGHKTVAWPNGDEVKKALQTRPLYGSSITRFVLIEWNRSFGGDVPTIEPQVEHVMPQKPVDEWFKSFTKDEHQAQLDLIANLLPLSEPMNKALSNGPYSEKREKYREDCGFKGTRQFAEEYEEWNPANLKSRAEKMAEWAAGRWKA
jgi:hypothetical protein